MTMAWIGTGVAVGGALYSGISGKKAANKQAKQDKENARMTQEMANYNASISQGHARQAIANSQYTAEFAEMQTLADVYLLEYQQATLANQAIYEDQVAEQIAIDGGINSIRKRKNDLKQLSAIEAESAGSGALMSGSVIEAMAQSAMNLEIDTLEINKLANIETAEQARRATVHREESTLLGKKAKISRTFGDMQQAEILRQGKLQAKDYRDEATRLQKYGRIDAQNHMAAASQNKAAGTATLLSGVTSAASTLSSVDFSSLGK